MATVDGRNNWVSLRKTLLNRELVSLFLAYATIVLTSPFWIPALTYFYIWSYLVVPSGAIAFGAAIALIGAFLLTFPIVFVRIMAGKRKLNRFIAANPTPADLEDQKHKFRSSIGPAWFVAPLFLVQLAIPPCIAIVSSNELGNAPRLASVNHKVIRVSKAEALRIRLNALAKRGLFTPYSSGD